MKHTKPLPDSYAFGVGVHSLLLCILGTVLSWVFLSRHLAGGLGFRCRAIFLSARETARTQGGVDPPAMLLSFRLVKYLGGEPLFRQRSPCRDIPSDDCVLQ